MNELWQILPPGAGRPGVYARSGKPYLSSNAAPWGSDYRLEVAVPLYDTSPFTGEVMCVAMLWFPVRFVVGRNVSMAAGVVVDVERLHGPPRIVYFVNYPEGPLSTEGARPIGGTEQGQFPSGPTVVERPQQNSLEGEDRTRDRGPRAAACEEVAQRQSP